MIIATSSFKTYIDQLFLQRPEENFKAGLCLCYFPVFSQHHEIEKLLHLQETSYYRTLKFEKRKKNYLTGRYAARQAISVLIEGDNLDGIAIQKGIFGYPIVTNTRQNVQLSITHCDKIAAAIAYPEAHPMAIDIEEVSSDKIGVLETQITEAEKNLMQKIPYSCEVMFTLLWTVKEALSKILKTGLMTPFHIFEISNIEVKHDYIISNFKNFAQYSVVSFKLGDYICSIAYPKKTEFNIDVTALKKIFKL
jgi:4'-phosphopantetheinyl transferase EntD